MTCDSSFRCSLASPASYLNPFPKRHRAYGMEPSPFTPTPHAPPAATQSVDASVGHQIGAATSLALTALMGMRLAKTRKVKGRGGEGGLVHERSAEGSCRAARQ